MFFDNWKSWQIKLGLAVYFFLVVLVGLTLSYFFIFK